ncbi:hypothetical protein Ptr86124_000445 [Pyrenophora tritici-repentis]|uniref:Fungal N-terminal domain-containing protein n=1 Tax=Pyrenophora tritici-repentis TaxID=45151 RepID=A0A922T476_9PLEO|nr:hypothetical protein Ptr86124_000445 [Pyrenophora tritici-repentis]
MSGTLELAAGVLAIVGAADVAVRTGREVHGFLRNIAGAPEEINRLCATVKEVAILAETAKQLLDKIAKRKQTEVTEQSIGLFEAALKSMNRELQNLRVLIARFRGGNNTWSRVRYVLDERKLNKAFENLERSKSLLGNSLQVASRYVFIDNITDWWWLNNRYIGLEIYQDTYLYSSRQRSDDQHQEIVRRHERERKLLSATRRDQKNALHCQAKLARTSNSIQRDTRRISKVLNVTHRENFSEHQKTRDFLSAKIEDVIAAELERLRLPLAERTFNRNIFFFADASKRLLSEDGASFSARQVTWLQLEFDNLVASAAQEEAARHHRSTATSLDQWHYSENIVRHPVKNSQRMIGGPRTEADKHWSVEDVYEKMPPSKPSTSDQPTYTHNTAFGILRVYIPQQATESKVQRTNDEAGFTFTCGIGQSIHAIHVHFLREIFGKSGPRLSAQLNVFTLAESEVHYYELFAHGSAEDIDDALRNGVISPYHINREGRNLCLYYAAEHARVDIFDYLDSQGIGIANLKHDISLVAGLFKRSMIDYDRIALETSVDHVLQKVYDTLSFLFETTMNMLLWDYYRRRPRSLLTQQIRRLQKEKLVPDSLMLDDQPWDWDSVSTLMNPLFAQDAVYVNALGSLGRNRIQRCSCVVINDDGGDQDAITEISNALIKAGVDIHHRDHDGLTPSMYSKRCGAWEGWCKALERNGQRIKDVLRDEDAEWLLDERWREIWVEKYGEM